jgi:uncharacterized protein
MFLGAGIGYRRQHRDALLATSARIRVLEVMPDHIRDPAEIEPLASRFAIVLHDVGMSFGTVGTNELVRRRLRHVRELATRSKAVLFSDHLALTRSPEGIDLGHLAPIWLTKQMLEKVADHIRATQDLLGIPVALENIAAPFTLPGNEMTEADFFCGLVGRTDCGVLLDLTNLLYNARNERCEASALLAQYPLEAVMQVHLAGGVIDREGTWVDSHSEPIEEATFALLRDLTRARPSLRAIVVERDEKLDDLADLCREARRAETIWEEMSR